MGTKRVAIFTTFRSADSAYSLNRVVQDQIKMLLYGGIKPLILVHEGFTPKEAYALEGVELFYLPDVPASNEGQLPEDWKEHKDKLRDALLEALVDVDVVIGHDIISQPAALIHNMSAREVAKSYPQIRWLHWVHSAFSSNIPTNIQEASAIGREKFPNSFIVFPNSYDIPRVAKNFNVEEPDVKWCPHPTDIEEFFGMHEVSRRFIKEKKLLEPEVLLIYPCRLDRGKQPHFLVELIGALKKSRVSAKVVIMDFHSTGGDKVVYRDEMKVQAKELDIENDVIFFSEFDKKFEYEAPQQVVKDLMMISNIFMLPSRSETYSLITQEAILCGNFIILNHDFQPFRSIFGNLPKYFQFSSNIGINGFDGATDVKYENIQQYFGDIAKYIMYMVRFDKILTLKTMFRRERNLYSVYDEFLKPLLYSE